MKHFGYSCIFWILTGVTDCSAYDHAESRLISKLFGPHYDNRARPPMNGSELVMVHFRLNLRQIYDVGETAQTVAILATTYQHWRDPRLQWNASDYDGLDAISVPYTTVWTPDTTLYNEVDMYRENVEDRGNVYAQWDGGTGIGALVNFDIKTKLTVGCRFDMTYFPFDEQNCTFTFGSWTYDQSRLDYHLVLDYATTEHYYESAEWELISFKIVATSKKLLCCEHPYKALLAHLVIRRRCLYYVFNLIIPTLIINIMASYGLFASAGNAENRHDKLQIGITILLSYCILLLTVFEHIPKGSSSIPLISWFFFSVMLQNAIKIYIAIFLSYPSHRKRIRAAFKHGSHMISKWLRIKRQYAVQSAVSQMNDTDQEHEEGRGPELVCMWVSMACLAFITLMTFTMAGFRIS